MRTLLKRATWLTALIGLVLSGAPSFGQNQNAGYEVPPPEALFPWPFGHPRMEDGGFYMFGGFLAVQQTNPLQNQPIAVRGFYDRDGSASLALGRPVGAGGFFGSKQVALNASDASGPSTYQPGFLFGGGWKFQNGVAVEFQWRHFVDARYSAVATYSPPNNPGAFLENTYVSSPVFNYPTQFAGPAVQLAVGNPGATDGVWNATSNQQISFVQRLDQFDITSRHPMWQSDSWRTYGILGSRLVVMWERFSWRVVDQNILGDANGDDVGIYSNVVSNRLYGVQTGLGNEMYLGTTPIGAFSFSADLQAGLYADFVKLRVRYERGDFAISSGRARNLFTLVPGVEGHFNFHWFPYEAIQLRMGYDIQAFFNTVASPEPVDFNYGGVAPAYEKGVTRLIRGFNFGVAFVF